MTDQRTETPSGVNPDKPPPSVGQWSRFPTEFKNPRDSLTSSLRTIRSMPQFSLPGVSLPPDHKPGEPLPVELEVRGLILHGSVGDHEFAMVTTAELLAEASGLWGLDQDGLKKLRDETIPSATAWADREEEKIQEELGNKKEDSDVFFLNTWDVERMDALASLISAVGESKVPGIKDLLERYRSLQRPKFVEAKTRLKVMSSIKDKDDRRQQISDLANQMGQEISVLTYLTPAELSNISRNEEYQGPLFLDTLVATYPALYETVQPAKKQSEEMKRSGVSVSVGEEFTLLDKRKSALKTLVYGAKDNHSVRGLIDKLKRKNEPRPNQSPQPE